MTFNQIVSSVFPIVLVAVMSFASATCASTNSAENKDAAQQDGMLIIRQSAEAGDAWAQNELGVLYYEGKGVPQNHRKAREWFDKAVDQGHAGAQVNLGTLYLRGEGATQSDEMAMFWFQRAAKQEDALAFAKLGLMYAQGRGVEKNLIQAHKFYQLSFAHGESRSSENRDALAKQMTPGQISEAERLACESTRGVREPLKC